MRLYVIFFVFAERKFINFDNASRYAGGFFMKELF